MKLKLFLTVLLLIGSKLFAQDSKVSLELNYPIATDNNFFGKNYNGIIDVGVDFKFLDLNAITIGAALNAGVFTNNSNNEFQTFKVTSYVIQPRMVGELDIETISRLHPSVGIGYTIMVFDGTGVNNINGLDVLGANDTQSGFNLNFGIAYDISKRLFAKVQYDFVKLNVDNRIPDIKFNTNVNILKIGLGYRL